MAHKKHTALTRPQLGGRVRNEIAFVGAQCGLIQETVRNLVPELATRYSVEYMDADHGYFDNPVKNEYLDAGFEDYIANQQVQETLVKLPRNDFDNKIQGLQRDWLFVNGNHFQAEAQVVFLQASKRKSLEKRLDQCTNIVAFVVVDDEESLDLFSNKADIPTFNIDDRNGLRETLKSYMNSKSPGLKGLILAGGKSVRMGQDKAQLTYNGKTAIERVADLMRTQQIEPFLSVRSEDPDNSLPQVTDTFLNLGPMGAILSALQTDPNSAWFVVACDLPLLDEETINQIVANRSPRSVATAFLNHETGFAEPLITIWEPKAYHKMLSFLALGYSCPRKVLINSDTRLIEPKDPRRLMNVNTPEDYKAALAQLQHEQ